MKQLLLSLSLLTPFALGTAACDSAPSKATDAAVADGADADTTDASAEDAAAEDATVVDTTAPDPCEALTCDAPPASHCELHRASRIAYEDGTCAVDDAGTAACEYAAAAESCGEGGVCILDACETVPSLCDFPFGPRISGLTLFTPGGQSTVTDPETGEPDDQCCFDLDGDGTIDNGLGAIFKQLEPFVGRAEDYFGAMLARDPMAIDLHGAESLADAREVDLLGYFGYPNSNGTITPLSRGFQPGTSLPPIAIAGQLVDTVFRATNGYYRFIVGIDDSRVFVELVIARAAFVITEADDGSGQLAVGPVGEDRGGRVGGWVTVANLVAGLNESARYDCVCTVFGGTEDAPVIDPVTYECIPIVDRTCDEPSDFCKLQTDPLYCQAFVNLINQPDVDLDGDGTLDAISAGFWITGEPTSLNTMQNCP